MSWITITVITKASLFISFGNNENIFFFLIEMERREANVFDAVKSIAELKLLNCSSQNLLIAVRILESRFPTSIVCRTTKFEARYPRAEALARLTRDPFINCVKSSNYPENLAFLVETRRERNQRRRCVRV